MHLATNLLAKVIMPANKEMRLRDDKFKRHLNDPLLG